MTMYIHHGPPLYLNADKTMIVAEDNPRAAWLLVAEGGTLPDEDAHRWGLMNRVGVDFTDAQRAQIAELTARELAPGEVLQEGVPPTGLTGEPIAPPAPDPEPEPEPDPEPEGETEPEPVAPDAEKALPPPTNKRRTSAENK